MVFLKMQNSFFFVEFFVANSSGFLRTPPKTPQDCEKSFNMILRNLFDYTVFVTNFDYFI